MQDGQFRIFGAVELRRELMSQRVCRSLSLHSNLATRGAAQGLPAACALVTVSFISLCFGSLQEDVVVPWFILTKRKSDIGKVLCILYSENAIFLFSFNPRNVGVFQAVKQMSALEDS